MSVINDVLWLWWLKWSTVDVPTQSRVSVDWSGRETFIASFLAPSPSPRGEPLVYVARELL